MSTGKGGDGGHLLHEGRAPLLVLCWHLQERRDAERGGVGPGEAGESERDFLARAELHRGRELQRDVCHLREGRDVSD